MNDHRLEMIRHRVDVALLRYKSDIEGGSNDGYFQMHGFMLARDIRDILDGEIPKRCESCNEFMVTCENPLVCACAAKGCSQFAKVVVKSEPGEEEPPGGWATCVGCLEKIEGARNTVTEFDAPNPVRRWHGLCGRVAGPYAQIPI